MAYIEGASGNDTLHGDTNPRDLDDFIVGKEGIDLLSGHAGNDSLFGGDDRDLLWGGDGNDELDGGAGNDDLDGGAADDTLRGGDGDDRLHGDGRIDSLASGNDVLEGGSGDDSLSGQEGDDWLDGGPGIDSLWGGPGGDVFYFRAGALANDLNPMPPLLDPHFYDRIMDFYGRGLNEMVLIDTDTGEGHLSPFPWLDVATGDRIYEVYDAAVGGNPLGVFAVRGGMLSADDVQFI